MEYKALEFRADSVDADRRVISGYASTWDKDLGGDIIERGAFAQTLATRANKVKVLWQHDQRTPIGKPQVMREDDRGLYVESYISRTAKGDEALTLAQDGIIDSMSIGFTLSKGDYDYNDDSSERVIRNLNLMEFSLVTWPMNEAAMITGVKSIDPREIERVLREAGVSRSQAKRIACAGVQSLREADQKDVYIDLFNQALNEFRSNLTGE